MNEFQLKYGCNPNQKPARIFMADGSDLPVEILNGRPGYINFLDAFNSWQLVKELKEATGMVAATSFKHVSPTSAAVGKKLSPALKQACFVDDIEGLDDSPLACAYARARGTDRMSSFGDWIALSDTCDEVTANIIKREVSDGIIAPAYTPEALAILKSKKKGAYNIVKIDPAYVPAEIERKQVFGVTFEQGRNNYKIDRSTLDHIVTKNKDLPADKAIDLIIALITLKYTQSNSVCFATDGQAIGRGRGPAVAHPLHPPCGTEGRPLAPPPERKSALPAIRGGRRQAEKNNIIDLYLSDEADEVLADGVWQKNFAVRPAPFTREEKAEYLASVKGVSLGSDAFFPFSDNIERAYKSGVSYVAEPGGSVRGRSRHRRAAGRTQHGDGIHGECDCSITEQTNGTRKPAHSCGLRASISYTRQSYGYSGSRRRRKRTRRHQGTQKEQTRGQDLLPARKRRHCARCRMRPRQGDGHRTALSRLRGNVKWILRSSRPTIRSAWAVWTPWKRRAFPVSDRQRTPLSSRGARYSPRTS